MCRVLLLGLLAVAVVAPNTFDPGLWTGCVGHAPTCTMLHDLYNACNGQLWRPSPWERWGGSSENRAYCHWQGIKCNSDQQLIKIDLSEVSEGMVCSELPNSLAPDTGSGFITLERRFSLRIPGASVTAAVSARVCNQVGGSEVKQLCHTRRWGEFWRAERATQTGGVHREGLPQEGNEIDTHWHTHWAGHWNTHWAEYWAKFWHLKYTANATNGRGAEAEAMSASITEPMKRWSQTNAGLNAAPHVQNPRDPNKFGWSGPSMGVPFGIPAPPPPPPKTTADGHFGIGGEPDERTTTATICINTQETKTAAQAVAACAPLAHLDLRAGDDNAQAIANSFAYSKAFNDRCTGSPPTCAIPSLNAADGYVGAERLWVSLKDAAGSANPAAPTSCSTKHWVAPNEPLNAGIRGCNEAFHAVCVAPVGMPQSMIPSSNHKVWSCRTASHALPRGQDECGGRSFCAHDVPVDADH